MTKPANHQVDHSPLSPSPYLPQFISRSYPIGSIPKLAPHTPQSSLMTHRGIYVMKNIPGKRTQREEIIMWSDDAGTLLSHKTPALRKSFWNSEKQNKIIKRHSWVMSPING